MKHNNFNFGTGSGRWADHEEIKNSPTTIKVNIHDDKYSGCGLPLISDGRTAYLDVSDHHSIVFGSTGSMKTRRIVLPLINTALKAGSSIVVTDPKGELFRLTSGLSAANGYKTVVLNLRNLDQSDCWNPLSIPHQLYLSNQHDKAKAFLNDFINTIVSPLRSDRDPYWHIMAHSITLAYLLFFIDTAKISEANIYNFNKFFLSHSSKKEMEELLKYMPDESISCLNLKGILSNGDAEKTIGNIASYVWGALSPFMIQKQLCQMMSQSTFDLRDIARQKTAVFLIIPDEKTTLNSVVALFLKQLYEILIEEAQQNEFNELPNRTEFILDEFGNVPCLPDFIGMQTASRSRNIRFYLFLQGMQQLNEKYGRHTAETIVGNCDNKIFLASGEVKLLEYFEKICGEVYDHGIDKLRPLITVFDLQCLSKEKGEAVIKHGRNAPLMSELPDFSEYKFKTYPEVKLNTRKLPKLEMYDAEQVIKEIKNGTRPLPFSIEVFGKEKYYDKSPSASLSDNDIWDW